MMNDLSKMIKKHWDDRLHICHKSSKIKSSWDIYTYKPKTMKIVYKRKGIPEKFTTDLDVIEPMPDENFSLYLHPSDAAVIGAILVAYAAAHGEKA